ncbi:hypothetical protein [Ruminococcus difficilis]|uniref:DUF2634 domain-containing protein n=1 Tax=Ruminococcus difficilis TaxID=2763069 RepID=A0A934WPK2_9FIRM|nr:hypothetical protein [Ruminococcus difficilis]MBK6088191.1 hypothetical protein [Ruminococcus difficilis]
MDVKVANGDIAMTASGDYLYITDIEEAVQRVRISALTMKGDFVYDRELGTDYRGLSADDEMLCEKLDMLIKESCADICDTQVKVQSCENLIAVIRVSYRNNETTTEVDLSGILQ